MMTTKRIIASVFCLLFTLVVFNAAKAQQPSADSHSASTALDTWWNGDIETRDRFGVSGWHGHVPAVRRAGLDFGAFVSWNFSAFRRVPADVDMWQMIRLTSRGATASDATIRRAVTALPGSVWIIGNEPDVIWQDNIEPARYAELYHHLYHLIKEADPTARVAIAAVAAPTSLRRAYLDIVLQSYAERYGSPLPVDLWTVHAYILREERSSWGAEIPPGMTWIDQGALFNIDNHADAGQMQQLLREFRAWMKGHGYDVPLAVTEFGILMPEDYGFPPDVVSTYQRAMVDFFLGASDWSGYSQDGGRLVQYWFWYSLYDNSGVYSVSDLYNPRTGKLTPIGQSYATYLDSGR